MVPMDTAHPERSALLFKELDEFHSYARAHFQQLISWFTFFLGANLIALGWIVDKGRSGKFIEFIVWFFLAQVPLAIGACQAARWYFRAAERRVASIRKELAGVTRGEESPFPYTFYASVTYIMSATCLSVLLLWIALLARIRP
jgi:hypothetical protein